MRPLNKVEPHATSVTFWREATRKHLSISKQNGRIFLSVMSLAENCIRLMFKGMYRVSY
jgi:hypothetical protein